MVKTINESYRVQYQQEKKRKILVKIFLFLVLFLSVAGGAVYFLFFLDFFNVREISIFARNGSPEIRSAVESYLAEKKFFVPKFSNILLVNAEQLSGVIAEKFPSAENIKVKKEYFHGLKISLDEKEAVGVWCYKKSNGCFYFDRQGVAFGTVMEASGSILLNISDHKSSFDKLGHSVSSPEIFNLVSQASEQLKKSKIAITKFIILAEEDFRLDIQTGEGWKIYLSTKDDLTKQLNNLDLFLSQKITSEKRAQLVYIDLTVPNRVYYK